MLEAIRARAGQAIEQHVFPGCVIGIVRRDGARSILPFGSFAYGTAEEPVTERTMYDLASITKSIPTASLAAQFILEGKLALSGTVRQYIPELQNDYGATIEDLLRYRVCGPQLSRVPLATFEEIRTHVFEQGFAGPSGDGVYTNLPAYLLGIVLERTGGKSLHVLAHEYFFDTLAMENTTFFPSAATCTPTEIDKRGEVRGLPHDESAYKFAITRRSVGHAGLFSTAPDLLEFSAALLERKFSHVAEAAQNGLGWQVHDPNFMGEHATPHMFGKTGFTGTSIICDIERGVGLVILSNRTFPKRPHTHEAINVLRRDIAEIVWGLA